MVDEEEKEQRFQRPFAQRILSRFRKTEDINAIPVDAVMKKGVVVIDASKRVSDAAKIMARNRIGSVVVMEKGRPVGIVTERDIARKIVAKGRNLRAPLKGVMSTPLRVIDKEKSVKAAAEMMSRYNIKRLPVTDKQRRLVGIVTDTDITRAVPGMLDLILELSNIERFEAETETVGVCSRCGNWVETLMNVGGQFLCEECREEEETFRETE